MRINLGLTAALVGVIVLLAFFYQSAVFSSRSGDDTPLYSVRRHDPYGTAALYDLLSARGHAVRTLQRPDLEPTDHGVLLEVLGDHESNEGFLSRPSDRVEWMSQGNIVVQLTQAPTVLMKKQNAPKTLDPEGLSDLDKFESEGGPPEQTPAAVAVVDANFGSHYQVNLWSPMAFAGPLGNGWKAVARESDEPHRVVAASVDIGKGKLIVIGSPTPALNGMIDREQNLDFLLGIIGNRPVIFDEWVHGIGHERTIVNFLTDVGLLPMLLQIFFVAAVYVWSTSGFAMPAAEAVRRQRSSAEQIETLGHLYSRSLGAGITYDRVEKEVQRRLAEALRCQPRELAARLNGLKPELRGKVQQVFARLGALRTGQGLRCPRCGYNLSFNESDNCPECGGPVSPQIQQKLAETQGQSEVRTAAEAQGQVQPRSGASISSRRMKGIYAALAEILSASHQVTMEVIRDRRGWR